MNSAIRTEDQKRFWNRRNSETRERRIDEVSERQAAVVRGWLERLGARDLDVLEAGCGAGWFCPELARFGRVTATDLSDEVLRRAAIRTPQARFVAGAFMQLDLGRASFDVAVSLKAPSHVADQPAFLAKLADHLRPGGLLMLATQNRPVLERYNHVQPPGPGQLRCWVDRQELAALLAPRFEVEEMFTVTPRSNRGVMRYVNSYKLNQALRPVVGDLYRNLRERAGLGWTIMALARRRAG